MQTIHFTSAIKILLDKIETKRNLLEHIIRKEDLEDVILTGQIERKRERGKQRITLLVNRWLLRPKNGSKLWRSMIGIQHIK